MTDPTNGAPFFCVVKPGTLTQHDLDTMMEEYGATPHCYQCGKPLVIGDTLDHYAPHHEEKNAHADCSLHV